MTQGLKATGKAVYAAGLPRAWRLHPIFWRMLRNLERSQWWSPDQLRDYQDRALRRLVHHAYDHVPYYRTTFREIGLRPDDIRSAADLRHIPLLTKAIVRERREELVADNVPAWRKRYVTTGGSTGVPVGVYHDRARSALLEKAFLWRSWRWAGIGTTDVMACSSGPVFVKGKRQAWYYNPLERSLALSSTDMTEDNLRAYVGLVKRYLPVAAIGYPSALAMLADFASRECSGQLQLAAAFPSSEVLLPLQRRRIEQGLGTTVYDYYGQTERVVAAAECQAHSGSHLFSEYGVAELIGPEGQPITTPGIVGELVGTGLHNYVMPLIRYCTGDVAAYAGKECACGRGLPLLATIDGRQEALVVTRDRRAFSVVSLNLHTDTFDHVAEFQFVQQQAGHLTLRLVPQSTYTERDTKRIMADVSLQAGPGMEVEIEFVTQVERTAAGKFTVLLQHLDVSQHTGLTL